ncbi:MAG TPA: PAS domain-containing protein, partial [Phycisphaerae bacterium]|nr:PAS domain-containing protein [Phycisphaerae bacterium]
MAGSWVWHGIHAGGRAGVPGGPEGSAEVGKDTAYGRLGTVDLGYGLLWAAGTAGLWTAGRRFRAGVRERNIALEAARRNEQAARESRAMLQLVMNTIPARVFWKDRNSVYLGCNVLFARDAGLSTPEEIIGRTDFDLGWREQAELYRADDRHVMESGIPKLRYEEPQTTPTGDRIYLRTSKVPLRDEDGRVIG